MKRMTYSIPIVHRPVMIVRGLESLVSPDSAGLCSVLEDLLDEDGLRSVFHGLPWMTPILGSGCLDLGDRQYIDFEAVDAAASRLDEDLGESGSMVVGFAKAMATERLHSTPNVSGPSNGRDTFELPPQPEGENSSIAETTVLLALTASLTQLYHLAQLVGPTPITRSPIHEIALIGPVRDSDTWGKEMEELLSRSRSLLDAALAGKNRTEPMTEARRILLTRIKDDLEQLQSLRFDNLRLLTEASWLQLLQYASVYPANPDHQDYPGWSELLLQLVMARPGQASPIGRRPRVNDLRKLHLALKSILQRPTESSWRDLHTGIASRRSDFYKSVASLLRAQANLFARFHASPADPEVKLVNRVVCRDTNRKLDKTGEAREVKVPHPVAFVTSFDLELEMALWATKKPFRVVVPAFAKVPSKSEVGLVWLTATLDPQAASGSDDSGLDYIQNPRDWRVASELFAEKEGGEYPIVVRLSGSPLMRLPADSDQVYSEDVKSLRSRRSEVIDFIPSLTIDEYTALRQSENEIFLAGEAHPGGLPYVLSQTHEAVKRTWVAFGVQLDDPAIRSRMIAQLSAGAVRAVTDDSARSRSGGEDETRGGFAGLAVNERIDEEQASVLEWLGFRLAVEINCGSLTDQILHCAEHLEAVERAIEQIPQNLDPSERESAEEEDDLRWYRAESSEYCALRYSNEATNR